MPIVTYFSFFLSVFREISNAFEVAYHTSGVVDIFRPTMGAVVVRVFIDITTIVAHGYTYIEAEVVTTCFSSYIQ